jgi:hypothetical protein
MDIDGQLKSLPMARVYCLTVSQSISAEALEGLHDAWKQALLFAGFEEPLPALLILAPGSKLWELTAADEAVVDQVVAASMQRIQQSAVRELAFGGIARLVGE